MNEGVEQLENRLLTSLHPVQPRPLFIEQLQRRLISPAGVQIEPERARSSVLVVLMGALAGLGLYWLIKKTMQWLS